MDEEKKNQTHTHNRLRLVELHCIQSAHNFCVCRHQQWSVTSTVLDKDRNERVKQTTVLYILKL